VFTPCEKDDTDTRGEHVLEAIERNQEQEAVGHTAMETRVVVAMCDGHQRFDLCKNVPHLNPNLCKQLPVFDGFQWFLHVAPHGCPVVMFGCFLTIL